jgi:CDP-paratose 2-epimerase
MRKRTPDACLLFASTNKVYGRLEAVGVDESKSRYEFLALPDGVTEDQSLDFCSPYGCSKGAADQYALDFHASYGLQTVVFRQSCIYGARQFGSDDQGWVAWFLIASLLGAPITIYGNGRQVRDLLYVDDLLDLYELVAARPEICAGSAFNVGGGPKNTLAVNELIAFIEKDLTIPITLRYAEWRTGDQPVFVADISKISTLLGWMPRVSVSAGLRQLFAWLERNRTILREAHARVGGCIEVAD